MERYVGNKQNGKGEMGTESDWMTGHGTLECNKAIRSAHMVLHLAALTSRATELPHTSASVGVCLYYLLSLYSDIAARGLFPVHFAVHMFKNTNGK